MDLVPMTLVSSAKHGHSQPSPHRAFQLSEEPKPKWPKGSKKGNFLDLFSLQDCPESSGIFNNEDSSRSSKGPLRALLGDAFPRDK